VNSAVDVLQVFCTDPDVRMLQELRTQMPPDDLPPGSTYGNCQDVELLADGTYSIYVMLDDDTSDNATARVTITVRGGTVVSHYTD
jgi:hypothetical protein